MPTWPSTLPQAFRLAGLQETEPDLVVMEQMDMGPPIIRRKNTANLLPFSGIMLLTAAQKAILRTFYQTYCATPFDFPDPDTGEAVEVVFMDRPAYQEVTGVLMEVTLKLGKVP